MAPTKVDPTDPAVRRLVYNMYRGMLGGYNDQANTIVDALPPDRVREDQGVYKQLEAIIRQTSGQAGDCDVGDGGCSAPPPPPPPPAPGGGIPSMRINSEIDARARSPRASAPGEPPAAIQNAMMTKDKKPFTYTPGGLDLSQIRSPRIQRRINRNMADEGVAAPPSAPAAAPAPPPGLHGQPPPPPMPQPAGQARFCAPAPPAPPAPAYAPPLGGAQAPVSAQAVLQGAANLRPTSIAPLRPQQPEPGSLYIAPLATPPAPAPAPAAPRAQLGSLYIPPVADAVDAAVASPPPPPQRLYSPASPQAGLHKAPTPWMSSQRQAAASPASPVSPASPAGAAQQGSRIIPIQIEGRESPASPQEAHLSQWQREQQLRQQQRQVQQQQPQPQAPWRTAHAPTSPPAQPGERVIPIRFESSNGTASPPAARQPPPFQQQQPPQYQPQHQPYQPQPPQYQPQQQQFQPQQQQQFQRRPQQYNSGPAGPEWSAGPPIQSNSFRVLQKITDDVPQNQQPGRMNEMNAAQLRRLQLNDEDRALMDRFKAQVDDEVYLHQEADPRYRGAAIPSRAFRMLQNMTGEDDGSSSMPLPSRISPAVRAAQQAVQDSAAGQAYIPPSEQTAVEPRKYVGAAIPSRSFRMLQAMTGSENCDPADTSDL